MNLAGAAGQLRDGSLGDHRAVFQTLAQSGLWRGPAQPGEALIGSLRTQLAGHFAPHFPAAARPRLTLHVPRHGASSVALTYQPDPVWQRLELAVLGLGHPQWAWSALVHLTRYSHSAYPCVWTPWNAWRFYQQHWGDEERFRRQCALDTRRADTDLTDADVTEWAERHSMLDPWTVRRVLGVPDAFRPLTLSQMHQLARTARQRALVAALYLLRAEVSEVPRSEPLSDSPLPSLLLLPPDDEGLTSELEQELSEGQPDGPSFLAPISGPGLRKLEAYSRRAAGVAGRIQAVANLLGED